MDISASAVSTHVARGIDRLRARVRSGDAGVEVRRDEDRIVYGSQFGQDPAGGAAGWMVIGSGGVLIDTVLEVVESLRY